MSADPPPSAGACRPPPGRPDVDDTTHVAAQHLPDERSAVTTSAPLPPASGTADVDYRSVFAALPAPKMVLSTDGVVLDVNAAFRAVFDGAPAHLVGRALADVLPGDARHELLAAVRSAARTGRPRTVGPVPSAGERPGTGGLPRWWLLTVTPATDPSGRVQALVLRAAEVTEVMAPATDRTRRRARVRTDRAVPVVVDALVAAVSEERAAAEALQGSVLTELPRVPGLQLDVRYRPADARSRIGGDWYDAFVQPSGATMLVVGDVTGHDVAAAGDMGNVRATLRALGYAEDASPAVTLQRAEQTLAGLGSHATATAVVATVVASTAGSHHLVSWTSAGHLPPVVVRADGAVDLLVRAPELLVGIDPQTVRSDRHAVLHPGETLLLYTDGVVEHRGEPVTEGLRRLVAAVAAASQDGPVDLDALLATPDLCGGGDDVTVLTARVPPRGAGQ
jgi:PAS domain S-box-containing protein